MKRLIIIAVILFGSGVVMAQTEVYYQMYDVESTDAILNKTMVYSDQNCTISYDFWGKSGNAGFLFQNNTDGPIYVDLSSTFLVCNGVAYDFYQSRRNKDGNGYHVETGDFCIPAHAARILSCDYPIYETIYTNCEMGRYPIVNLPWEKVKDAYFNDPRLSVSFTRENSPMVFKTIIFYRKGSSAEIFNVENEFYISRITGFNKSLFIINKKREIRCGKEEVHYGNWFRFSEKSRFYNEYYKD